MDETEVVKYFKIFFKVLQTFSIHPFNLSTTENRKLRIYFMVWSTVHLILMSVLMFVMFQIKNTVFFDADNLGLLADLFRSHFLFASHFIVVLEVIWYHDDFIKMFEYMKDIEETYRINFKYLVKLDKEYMNFFKMLRNLSLGFLVYYVSVEVNAILSCDRCWNNIVVFFIPQIMIFMKQLQFWIYVKLITIYLIQLEKVLKEIVNYSCYNQRLKSQKYNKFIEKKIITIKLIYSNIQNITTIINKIFGCTQLIFVFKVNLWILMDFYWVIMNLNSSCNLINKCLMIFNLCLIFQMSYFYCYLQSSQRCTS